MYRTLRFDAARDEWRQVGTLYVAANEFPVSDEWGEDWPSMDWGIERPDGVILPLPDGRVLFAGGTDERSGERAAGLLDPDDGTWTALPPLPEAIEPVNGLVMGDGSVLLVDDDRHADAFRLVLGP